MKRTLGVCYYPEQWPEEIWAEDAQRMVAAGLSWVRIGEFAWSRIEPKPGQLEFDWMDRAIETLGAAGLQVILGTPTATPPRWMLTKHPDMLACSEDGKPRGFGSRRHYCFSHDGYRQECLRIVDILGARYGKNPHVKAWQTDNEYGCHDTTISYSNAARLAFRDWLSQRYQSIDALNRAWGKVFWSMEYASFDEIDLPNLTVTEPNPSHAFGFRRFSSDQVVSFNRLQALTLRKYTDAPLIHNYMGRITEFDHYKVGTDLDIASWDSYPLGFLEDRMEDPPAHKRAFAQQGDPDFQAFHHDLYRSVGKGRLWIMEQQPGPVNWAPVNPAPLPGMARLWAWEAFAHGAETVCYFRWRQAPFAQEQMHAGLLRPDSVEAAGLEEARQVAREIDELPEVSPAAAQVALVFDYASDWAWSVQPQGAAFSYFRLCFEMYRGLRKLGLDVDIISPDDPDLSQYKLLLAPGTFTLSETFLASLETFSGTAILGPRCNSRTPDFQIPTPLPPALPGLDVTVRLVETFRDDMPRPLQGGGHVIHWMEQVATTEPVQERTTDGHPILMGGGKIKYLAGWPDEVALHHILESACEDEALPILDLKAGLRVRRTDAHVFAFNYGTDPAEFEGETIPPAGVFWRGR